MSETNGFSNRAEILREHNKRFPGDYKRFDLYQEMANINEGIAEILHLLTTERNGK